MSKISISLEDGLEADLDSLVKTHPDLNKRNRSALINYLVKKEAQSRKRQEMIEAAVAIDELNLGWSEEEEYCAIIDAEVSG